MRKIIFNLLLLLSTIAYSNSNVGSWNVQDYGAVGNGIKLDTKAIQSAINECHNSGGGKVYLSKGKFLSGTIYLKSNVTLYIEQGAVLVGSIHQRDYPVIDSKYPSYHGTFITNRMLIYAEDAENISIVGNGTIDGNGSNFIGINEFEALKERPRIIHFRKCKNIKVKNINLINSASWVQNYMMCDNLLIDGIVVESRENKDINKERFADAPGRNTDGLDIVDCRNVRISNCYINSGDDGICLKSLSQKEGCHNITITNCIISTNASGVKIGTESVGAFKDIIISNCSLYDLRLGGIDIMCVDGAYVERVLVSNITLRNVNGAAVFLRLGDRGRMHRTDEVRRKGHIKDVMIQNIYGTGIERYGCSITGIPDLPIENIVLRNINLIFKGGDQPFLFQGEKDNFVNEHTIENVPEIPDRHPRSDMFGKLPAYGFYVRHVKDIQFSGIRLNTIDDENRPAMLFDNVADILVDRFTARIQPDASAPIYLRNVQNCTISNSNSEELVPNLVLITGNNTKSISLLNNDLSNFRNLYQVDKRSLKNQVTIKN